jgi:hypothetical protein
MLSEVEALEPGDELLGLTEQRPIRPLAVGDQDARVSKVLRRAAGQRSSS